VYTGLDPAFRVQRQPAVTGCRRSDSEIAASRQELDAGGRRGQQPDIPVHAVEFLMYVSPEYSTYLWIPVDDLEKFTGIVNGHGIEPATPHENRLVMQANQCVTIGSTLQVRFQRGQRR
jgi:hypothetical protein